MTGNSYQSAMREGHHCAWALKWDEAVDYYRQAVAQRPDDIAARTSLATAFYRLGRFDEALAEYRALLQLAPNDDSALVRLAEIQERRGVARDIAEAFMNLADAYLLKDRRDQAIRTWLKLSELLPNELEVQEMLYRSVSKAGETMLAGKIGLAITKLRGELDSKHLHGQSPSSGPQSQYHKDEGADSQHAEAVAEAMQQVVEARAFAQAGSMQDALLSYAAAVAGLAKAGVVERIAELEHSAEVLAGRFGGVRLRDLASLASDRRKWAIQHMVVMRDELDAGQTMGAIDDCFAAISCLPEYLPFQIRLAEAQEQQGESQAAATRYLSIAEVYVIRRDFAAGLAMVDKAAALGFVSTQVREGFVTRLMEAGATAEAKDQILVLAEELTKAGSRREAIVLLERAVALAPEDALALARLGAGLDAACKHGAAVEVYRRALASGDLEESLRLDVARRLGIAASIAEIFDDVETALGVLLHAADSGYLENDDLTDYASAMAQNPESAGLRLCYGSLSAHLGRRSEAVPNLERALGAHPRIAAPAHLLLARLALDEDINQAAEHLSRAERLLGETAADDARHWSDLRRVAADVSERRGELDQAVLALDEVKRLVPGDKQVYPKLAELHFRRGDIHAATRELLALGDLQKQEGQHEQAFGVFSAAAQLDPSDVEIKGKLSEVYRLMGRSDEALVVMDEMAALLASRGDAQRAVHVLREMIALSRRLDPAEALNLRKRVADLMPESFDARHELVGAYLATGQSDAALSEATILWQDMFAAGRWREAAGALEQILLIDPWNAEALVHLGEVAEKLGERTRSMDNYRRALAIDPDNIEASTRLTRLAAE